MAFGIAGYIQTTISMSTQAVIQQAKQHKQSKRFVCIQM